MQKKNKGMQKKNNPRAEFSSGLGTLAATVGSAVGLGNIWKFPSLTGANGGAAFLIIYIVCTLLVGLPVMIAELSLGRKARVNAFHTFEKLSPGSRHWRLAGLAGVLSAFFIMAFYTEVAGWVFAYIFKSLTGSVITTDPKVASEQFVSLISSPWEALFWQWMVFIVIGFIIILGVSKGIEATTKKLMPVLFVMLIILCVRGLTLENGSEGLAFLFNPDFGKVTGVSILTAMGLSFFKLSTGMGTMITYGSYFSDTQNIPATAFRVMLADLMVSLLAGIAIFPAVFSFGFKPDAGASLLFITVPAVFASLPFGQVFVVIFFILAAIAATGAMISLLEVPVVFIHEKLQISRAKSTVITLVLMGIFGAPASLSGSSMSGVKIFGLSFFDMYDYLTSNILMPIGGITIAIFAAWIFGGEEMKRVLTNEGALDNAPLARIMVNLMKYVTPVLVLIILLKGLNIF